MSGHPSPTDPPADGSDPAARHLSAALHERRLRGIRKAVHLALLVVGEATSLGGPSIADLVVTRIDTGAPVIRTGAGSLEEADALLRRINDDLETLTVEGFLAEWGHLKP